MCFYNKAELLAEFRKRKEPIILWKRGKIDYGTGTLYTQFNKRKVEWLPGTTVKPHEICKVLEDQEQAKSGLYFNTTQIRQYTITHVNGIKINRVITAQVHPKNIIGVNYDGTVICCTKATVIVAPKADLKTWLAAGLKKPKKKFSQKTKGQGTGKKNEMNMWNA